MRRKILGAAAALAASTVFLAGCDFSVYDMPLPGGADTGADPLTVEVEFSDALDLVPQSRVKVADVDVGKVTSVDLENGVAVVALELQRDTELPSNTMAKIGQTSLLGEKYVELEPPKTESASDLSNGDRIPLARSGRNPEVEEVLGALSLILNGGGVAQLKTIATELNSALGGREEAAKSVIEQLDVLMNNLDDHKDDITRALTSITRLSREVRDQRKTINATLDELPSALESIDQQRDDLTAMLKALENLGDVGVRVIKASKDNVVSTMKHLQPVLSHFNQAGENVVDSLNTFLTFPFVDASVGTTPQQARNLHMGDYVNLDIGLNIDLRDPINNPPVLPGLPKCTTLRDLGQPYDLDKLLDNDALLGQLCDSALTRVNNCINGINSLGGRPAIPDACAQLPLGVTRDIIGDLLGIDPVEPKSSNSTNDGGLLGGLGDAVGGLLGQNRAPVGSSTGSSTVTVDDLSGEYDPGLATMLIPALDPDAAWKVGETR